MELFKFYPAVPPNGRSNPGSTLVEYDGIKVWFSFTYEVVMLPDGSVYPETSEQMEYVHKLSELYAQMHIKAHKEGRIVIAPECFDTPPTNEYDQRPIEEQSRPAPSNNTARLPDNWLRIRKVVRGTTQKGDPQIQLYSDPNSNRVDLRITPKMSKPINAVTGIDWSLDINQGKSAVCDFVAEWKSSDDGKFKNFVKVVEPATPSSTDTPF